MPCQDRQSLSLHFGSASAGSSTGLSSHGDRPSNFTFPHRSPNRHAYLTSTPRGGNCPYSGGLLHSEEVLRSFVNFEGLSPFFIDGARAHRVVSEPDATPTAGVLHPTLPKPVTARRPRHVPGNEVRRPPPISRPYSPRLSEPPATELTTRGDESRNRTVLKTASATR